jgi:Zn finger protein HypA/HybF involved in hydrogenase expression
MPRGGSDIGTGGESTNVQPFARTLEQELTALLRGASYECLVCGEFVMHARAGVVFCPECGSQLGDEAALAAGPELEIPRLDFGVQAG